MKVKELIRLLKGLDQDAVIDMASDEEGNSFGGISTDYGHGHLKECGEQVYTLYPVSSELPEDRYRDEE